MKPNGRPPQTERNNQVIADFKAGMPVKDIAQKHGLGTQYTQKIYSEYLRKKQLEADGKTGARGLYADRDNTLIKTLAELHGKAA